MKLKKTPAQQILDVARKNNNHISYAVALDLLKDSGSQTIDADFLEETLRTLTAKGVIFENCEDTEDYGENDTLQDGMFVPADVHITPRNMTIDTIVDRLMHDEIDLAPEFQRRSGLWTAVQQSRLIESMMLKIPIPTFYFDAADEEKWVVIDGLQRLTSLYNFMVSEELKLEGLEYLTEFNGYGLEDLPRQYYRRIRETQIQIYTIEKGTPEEVVFNIFKRINTGGLNLTPQEIRHALYQGKATRLVKELAENEWFLKATNYAIRTDRMLDCEYVTRYLAFTQLDYRKEYNGNIDSFLIKALKLVNTYNKKEIEGIKTDFEAVMRACYRILGKYAFRKISPEGRRGPINKALFEMWTLCIFHCDESEEEILISKKQEVLKRFQQMLGHTDILNSIKSGDKYSVTNRIAVLEKMIGEILND